MAVLMLPSNDSLRCFVAAAKTLNFRSAAQAVGLTPAALGQRVKQLEDQLGRELFHRTTRSVQLTEAGLALLPRAERALSAVADCLSGGAESDMARTSVDITMGTRHELGMSWVLPSIPIMTIDKPWLAVHLYFGSGSDLVVRVRSLEIDCAITSSRFDDPKLEGLALHPETYAFVASKKLLKKRPLARATDSSSHQLIDVTPGLALFHYFRSAPRAPELSFARVKRMGTIAAAKRLIMDGEGVGVLPEYFIANELESGVLQRLFPQVRLLEDGFQLVIRRDDARRSVYEGIATRLRDVPLR